MNYCAKHEGTGENLRESCSFFGTLAKCVKSLCYILITGLNHLDHSNSVEAIKEAGSGPQRGDGLHCKVCR